MQHQLQHQLTLPRQDRLGSSKAPAVRIRERRYAALLALVVSHRCYESGHMLYKAGGCTQQADLGAKAQLAAARATSEIQRPLVLASCCCVQQTFCCSARRYSCIFLRIIAIIQALPLQQQHVVVRVRTHRAAACVASVTQRTSSALNALAR